LQRLALRQGDQPPERLAVLRAQLTIGVGEVSKRWQAQRQTETSQQTRAIQLITQDRLEPIVVVPPRRCCTEASQLGLDAAHQETREPAAAFEARRADVHDGALRCPCHRHERLGVGRDGQV
jgi:hypothetical protein